MFQVYKQGAGACDLDGRSMEPGWYWVRTRENSVQGDMPPTPYGLSSGPFRLKSEAERAARNATAPCRMCGYEYQACNRPDCVRVQEFWEKKAVCT